jgi:RNA polymerase sigma factor (sigma-70 family)
MALISGSLPAAEDAVQEALARAWELGERGRHVDALPAWVATVARNLLRDRFRRILVERRARVAMTDPEPTSGPFEVEERTDLGRALAGLARRQREVAVLRYYLDFDIAEIASVLAIPAGTVRGALHRARHSLARALGEHNPSEVADVAR